MTNFTVLLKDFIPKQVQIQAYRFIIDGDNFLFKSKKGDLLAVFNRESVIGIVEDFALEEEQKHTIIRTDL